MIGQFWWVWNTTSVGPGETKTVNAYCPDNYLPTGGGFSTDPNDFGGYVQVVDSVPVDNGNQFGWVAAGTATGGGKTFNLAVWVICAAKSGK